jgi:EAL domain-containing protein (putative c-di-GMP-specific phosphodiesterase class I)
MSPSLHSTGRIWLHSLKELGIQLALDDFGTGYSSLSHLKRFPIDALKIDHSFVRNLATNAEDAIIVGLVVNMGKALHMRVVAEGVETPEQLAALQKLACPLGQGHCFDKAMVASEFSGLLARAGLEARARECYPVVQNESDRLLPDQIAS